MILRYTACVLIVIIVAVSCAFLYTLLMKILPENIDQLKRLFWDKPLSKNDFDDYPQWVIRRVLEYGNLDDVGLLIRLYGYKQLLLIVSEIRFHDPLTENFWHVILESENIPCMRKSSHPGASRSWMD